MIDPFSDIVDLLLPFETMAALAGAHRRRDARSLDAFLLTAGLNQIVEDYLHRDVYSLSKVARRLEDLAGWRAAPAVASGARLARAAGLWARNWRPAQRRLIRWQADLAACVSLTASKVAGRPGSDVAPPAEAVVQPVPWSPRGLRGEVVRLAQCFRSFDQRPEDCQRFAQLFAERFPDRGRAVLVVGLRTSGSYLAPLVAASLGREGYSNIGFLTLRPGHDLLPYEVRRLARAVRGGDLVCVVDDPPRTGLQLSEAAEQLLSVGVRPDSLVLLVQLFGPLTSLPSRLEPYRSIVLPWEQWAIHERFSEDAVRDALRRLLCGRTIASAADGDWREVVVDAVEDVTNLTPATDGTPARGHVSAVFRAQLVDRRTREEVEHDIVVQGVGLGYLGRHALAVASCLPGFTPEVYGLEDGLLYRAWLPEEWRLTLSGADEDAVADRVAAYVVARREALAVADDPSRSLRGRGPVWELVAELLGDAFGRAKDLSRPLTRHSARRFATPARPSIVDGSMGLSHWFAPPSRTDVESMQKVDFAERAYSNEDAYCYDAVFDLACAAANRAASRVAEGGWHHFGDRLRSLYETRTGERITNERWLLYQLLYHHRFGRRKFRSAPPLRDGNDGRESAERAVEDSPARTRMGGASFSRLAAARHAMALAHQRYFGDLFFSAVRTPESGPLCAIDVDWVLESRWLGFPAISPTGASMLRALLLHGYRPVLATGRSVAEVRARCKAYRLPGGVAEYGAAVYTSASDCVRSLLTSRERDDLAQVRDVLAEIPNVSLDPLHEYTIRAHRLDSEGRLGHLDQATVEDVLERAGVAERVRVITAPSQTDFVVAHVDKGRGVRALAEELDGDADHRGIKLAFAIGDSIHDLPMLMLADRAFAPSNAALQLRELRLPSAPIEVVGRPAQAGLQLAVSAILGHRPGTCDVCAPPRPASTETRMLLATLAGLDGGRRARIKQTLLLLRALSADVRTAHRGSRA